MNIVTRLTSVERKSPTPAETLDVIRKMLNMYSGKSLRDMGDIVYTVILAYYKLEYGDIQEVPVPSCSRMQLACGVQCKLEHLPAGLRKVLYLLANEIMDGTCPDFE